MRRLLAETGNNQGIIWDLEINKRTILSGAQGSVTSATFDCSGRRVAIASGENVIRIYDIAHIRDYARLPIKGEPVGALTNSNEVAILREGGIPTIINLYTDEIYPFPKHVFKQKVGKMAVSQSGNLVLLHNTDGHIQIVRISDSAIISMNTITKSQWLEVALFSHNEQELIGVFSDLFPLRWCTSDGSSLEAVIHNNDKREREITAITYTKQGGLIFGNKNFEVLYFRQNDSGEFKLSYAGGKHTNRINHIDINSDGTRAVSCSEDNMVKIYAIENNFMRVIEEEKLEEPVVKAIFACDDRKLVIIEGDTARISVLDIETWNREILPQKSPTENVNIDIDDSDLTQLEIGQTSPPEKVKIDMELIPNDSNRIVVHINSKVTIWDLSNLRELAVFENKEKTVYGVLCSRNGDYLLTWDTDYSISKYRIFDDYEGLKKYRHEGYCASLPVNIC